jgi:hypothetical protein
VEAPDGTMARPEAPEPSTTSTSTVGLPRESRTSLPITCSIKLTVTCRSCSAWGQSYHRHHGTPRHASLDMRSRPTADHWARHLPRGGTFAICVCEVAAEELVASWPSGRGHSPGSKVTAQFGIEPPVQVAQFPKRNGLPVIPIFSPTGRGSDTPLRYSRHLPTNRPVPGPRIRPANGAAQVRSHE